MRESSQRFTSGAVRGTSPSQLAGTRADHRENPDPGPPQRDRVALLRDRRHAARGALRLDPRAPPPAAARAPPPPPLHAAPRRRRRRLTTSHLPPTPPQPYFAVPAASVKSFEALLPRLVAATAGERGCLFYEFSASAPSADGGVTLFCREGYADGAAAAAHVGNIGEALKEALPFVTRVEVHGPLAETALVRAALPDAAYYELRA